MSCHRQRSHRLTIHLISNAAPQPPSHFSTGARPKLPKAGRPPGKKPLTANSKFLLHKQQEAAAKHTKPLTQPTKKITGPELLPYQHGRIPFEGWFNELVDQVSTALTPKRKQQKQYCRPKHNNQQKKYTKKN